MDNKVFISYSHKDVNYYNTLKNHLKPLERQGQLRVWGDREIIASDNWESEIHENLTTADIIIFLVSPDFIASDYCHDIEVREALKKDTEKTAIVFPIIVRTCMFESSPFSHKQYSPRDNGAISNWSDQDAAWVDVIAQLRQAIQKNKLNSSHNRVSDVPNTKGQDASSPLTDKFEEWIYSHELQLTHRKVDVVRLDDVYVVPYLTIDGDEKDEVRPRKRADEFLLSTGHYVVAGEEQDGKSSLLKFMFMEMNNNSSTPVYIDCEKLRKSDLNAAVKESMREQYTSFESVSSTPDEEIVLFLDNIDKTKLNRKYLGLLLTQAQEKYKHVICTCHSSFIYISNEIPIFSDYNVSELLPLGYENREELVRKWVSLGIEEEIEEEHLFAECEEITLRLNSIVRKNILPAKPVYVLVMLQMFEAGTSFNLELTSYGHCYQQLIYQSFDNAKIAKSDFNQYFTVLTELAWEVFVKGEDLNQESFRSFAEKYVENYIIDDLQRSIRLLKKCSILKADDHAFGFKYPYLYYFFVGRKIAESYNSSDDARSRVEYLLASMHREDYANILIFITHHTKDEWVLSEIKGALNSVFEGEEKATLDKLQLSFMRDFTSEIPQIVMQQREIHEERDSHNRLKDELELELNNESEATEDADLLSKINQTFKGMEIAGQIIRNRSASLVKKDLIDLAGTGVDSGLRFLNYFVSISDSARKEIIRLIANQLADESTLTDRELERHAETAYHRLTFGVINGVVRKIAASIGSKEALPIYDALRDNDKSAAVALIRQSIELQFKRGLDVPRLRDTMTLIHDNPVCVRILREMVVQYTYMFPVKFAVKQQIADILGVSVRTQRLLERRSKKSGGLG